MSPVNFFNQPIQIGDLVVKNRVFLAPLAGVSDIPFRRICQEMGAGLTYVEMLSATAIAYQNKRTFEMMARHAQESVLGVQVTGPCAEQVASAVRYLDEQGFDTIDINMGCPVKKVVNAGCGSGFLKDPQRISETIKQSRAATNRPLSVKYRIGYTRDAISVTDTTERALLENVDMFTVHGRTRSEGYETPCDHKNIAKAIEVGNRFSSTVVKVGNGDLFSYSSAYLMQQNTHCDAVMVSRGALGNPWIFQEILNNKPVAPSFAEWLDLVMRHISYQQEHYGNNKLAAILARKHLLWYTKGFPASKAVRETLNRVESLDAAREILKSYAANIANSTLRSFSNGSEAVHSSYDPKYEMDRVLDRGVGAEDLIVT